MVLVLPSVSSSPHRCSHVPVQSSTSHTHRVMDANRDFDLLSIHGFLFSILWDRFSIPRQPHYLQNFTTKTLVSCSHVLSVFSSQCHPAAVSSCPAPWVLLGLLSLEELLRLYWATGTKVAAGHQRDPKPGKQAEGPVLSQPDKDEQTELPQQQSHAGPSLCLCFSAQWWHSQRHSQCKWTDHFAYCCWTWNVSIRQDYIKLYLWICVNLKFNIPTAKAYDTLVYKHRKSVRICGLNGSHFSLTNFFLTSRNLHFYKSSVPFL